MIDFKEVQKIVNIQHKLYKQLQLPTLSYSDYNIAVVLEEDNKEQIIPVKEISFKAKPNTKTDAIKTIIDTYTNELNWEFVKLEKQVWVNGNIKYKICFKL